MRNVRRSLQAALGFLLLALPGAALGVEPYPPILCNGLIGCGAPPDDVILHNALPTAGLVLMQIVGGGAIIAIVVSATTMMLSYGDDAKANTARSAILWALGGLALAISAVPIVTFVTSENYGFEGGLLGVMGAVVRIIMTLMNAGFIIMVILAGYQIVLANGSPEEFKKGLNTIKWAVIGGIIINVARAGVEALLALNL